MAVLSDVKFDKLRLAGHTGAMPEMTLAWLQAGGATSDNIADAWREYLDTVWVTGDGDRNTDWFDYLGSLGHTGTLNNRERLFWTAL